MTDNLLETNNNDEVNIDELLKTDTKYKGMSQDDLIKKALHADATIDLFKRRQDELRDDYLKLRQEHMTGATLDEIVDKLAQRQQQLASSDDTQANEVKVPTLEELEAKIEQKMEERERSRTAAQNFQTVQAKLKERFGDNASKILKEQADKLGFTTDDVNNLAKKSPDAFFRTFGVNETKPDSFQAPPRSDVRSDNFKPTNQNNRTWSYYQDLKAKNPTAYYDAKTHNQMVEDYARLGKDFEDGDFSKFGRF